MIKPWLLFTVVSLVFLALAFSACAKPAPAPVPSPAPVASEGTVIQNDSIVLGLVTAVRKLETGYPWEVKVRIIKSENVGNLENPTRTKVGMTITTVTDEDMSSLGLAERINANVKLMGDAESGTVFFMYNINIEGRGK